MNYTPLDLIRDNAARSPGKPAIIECTQEGAPTRAISWQELMGLVEDAAGRLAGMGLAAGDAVALDLHNGAELLVINYAAWSTGVITVPLDTKRDTQELRDYKFAQSKAKCTLSPGMLAQAPLAAPAFMAGQDAPALILYTSGTTARPKGALLTLSNLCTNAAGIVDWLRINGDDRFLVQLPLHHINSTTFCLVALSAGASVVLPPHYSHSRFWQQASQTGATLTSIVPSIVHDQLGRVSEFEAVKETLQLRRIQVGSAPVVVSELQAFMEKFGIPLYQGYGQTETALRVTGMPMNLSAAKYKQLVAENSIGIPMPWAQLEIASPDGILLKEGEEGELVVKGKAVMQGYLGGEEAFRDGWFLTGDIGYWKTVEDRRFFFLKGRSKELVIKGGVNISPVAVEDALSKVSGDISQAFVVGVSDGRYGEVVGAAIVWREGVEPLSAMRSLKLKLLLGTPHLSAYETPAFLAAIAQEELPTTSTGKVQRVTLKRDLADRFEPLETLIQNNECAIVAVGLHSPLAQASHQLYNKCWDPLAKTEAEYDAFLRDHLTLGAVLPGNKLAGQITVRIGEEVTCISICSSNFTPKAIPAVAGAPSVEDVRSYLLAGHDPVMNFHSRLGARLEEVIPQGRPEDKSSMGYTMLLSYPALTQQKGTGSASEQLIEAARLVGGDLGKKVYALSRPGGLARYLASHA